MTDMRGETRHTGVGNVFAGAAVDFHLDEEFGFCSEFGEVEVAFRFGHGYLSFQIGGA